MLHAGRVLWMIPDKAGAPSTQQGNEGRSKEPAPTEVEQWMTKAFKGLEPAAKQDGSPSPSPEKDSSKQHALEIERQSPGKARASADKDNHASQMSVIEVDRSVFERILLTMEMGNDHLPDAYLEAVQTL